MVEGGRGAAPAAFKRSLQRGGAQSVRAARLPDRSSRTAAKPSPGLGSLLAAATLGRPAFCERPGLTRPCASLALSIGSDGASSEAIGASERFRPSGPWRAEGVTSLPLLVRLGKVGGGPDSADTALADLLGGILYGIR